MSLVAAASRLPGVVPDPIDPQAPRGRRALRVDPRVFQLAAQSLYLGAGLVVLGFDVSPAFLGTVVSSCLVSQLAFSRLKDPGVRLVDVDLRSALITALSLCLLLRTQRLELAALAAVMAVASKFIFRAHGRHLFNPATFGLVVLLLAARPAVWTSPAQFGFEPASASLFLCGGLLVCASARVLDLSLGFLCFFAALVFGRALYLDEPVALPLHSLSSGSLLLFAFHMISDPRPAPLSRAGRLAFAACVAVLGFVIQFYQYRSFGLLVALFMCAPLIPVFDTIWPPRKKFGGL